MGIYVNPGNHAFRESLNSMIYVDKSKLIAYTNRVLNTKQKNLCVSRPRRFGKSMAADMLVAYYSKGCESSALFEKLKIKEDKSYKEHLNRHHVIRLDVQRFLERKQDLDTFITEIEYRIVAELVKEFPGCNGFEPGNKLKDALDQIFIQTAKGFVFIIDEWDCVFRIAKEREEIQKIYLDFLRGLFKGAEYIDLAYMTGILPIKKYGEHSAVNIFDEYSMLDPKGLGGYFGFTKEEVKEQCEKQNVDDAKMELWYDGYCLGNLHIYNPKSVSDALIWKEFQSYWTGTETYEALKIYIDMNFDGMKETIIDMLGGAQCKVNIRQFQNDMTTFKTKDDVVTLLIHLGYLTYNKKTGRALIPNREISQEFLDAIDGAGWNGLIQALNRSEELLKYTWMLDGNKVAERMEAIHNETASILKYNDENALTCTILMAYYSAKTYYMNPILELPSGKGYADVVYLPRKNIDKPALVIELKRNQSTEIAIAQIKEREYASWIQEYTGDILFVGINYNEKKGHTCAIERYRNV